MATQTYDFSVPGDYTTSGVGLTSGDAQISTGVLTGTVLGNLFFKGILINSVTVSETLNGGQVFYGLEIDTVLSWHDGASWVPSNGTPAELNTLAQLQTNVVTAIGLNRPIVRPYVLLSRTLVTDPSPVVDDIVFDFETAAPNQQLIMATDANVALDTGVGGAASLGETRVTTDPAQVLWTPGANDLFVFRNGVHQQLGVDYIEEDATHVVFTFLLDAVAPFIDSVELRSATQGMSTFLPAPTCLKQAVPPERPDNFGGIYVFA